MCDCACSGAHEAGGEYDIRQVNRPTHARAYTHARARTYSHIPTHRHTRARAHTHAGTHAGRHACTCARAHTHTHTYTHARARAHAHACTHTHTHARKRAQAYTRAVTSGECGQTRLATPCPGRASSSSKATRPAHASSEVTGYG